MLQAQWNKIESPEVNPRTFRHLIVDKEYTRIYSGEKIVSSISGAWETEQLHVKE